MPVTIYGIKTCETMRKARTWLEAHRIDYAFHDLKAGGIAPDQLEAWSREVGWETLINRTGTTFRKLPAEVKAELDADKAIRLMLEQPSMIKRPVLDAGGRLVVGFKPEVYAATFN
jgi:Spx/MgsR family transcriptional regulator